MGLPACGVCGQPAPAELSARLPDSSSPRGLRTVRGCTATHLAQQTDALKARPWEAAELWLGQLICAQDELEAEQAAAAGVRPMMRPSLEEAARRARLTEGQLQRAVDFNTRRLQRVELELAALAWADSSR